jgi:putative DNA primase/helicase
MTIASSDTPPLTDNTLAWDFLRVLHPADYRELRAFRARKKTDEAHTYNFRADEERGPFDFAERFAHLDVYVGVATRASSRGGTSQDCRELYALFADLDFKDSSEADVRQRLDAFPHPPSAIVFSGGGLQAFWLLAAPLSIADHGAKSIQTMLRRLATALGGDLNATDAARVLRLPGTLNHKYDPPRDVRLESFRPDLRYDLDMLLADLPPMDDSSAAPRAEALPSTIASGQRNDTLFREGCRLRRLGHDEAEIFATLVAMNARRCTPPLDESELRSIARGCAGYAPAPDTAPLTDTGNAECFEKTYGDRFRYDHALRQWAVFNGHHWRFDQTAEVDRASLVVIRARQAAALTIADTDARKRHLRWTIESESRPRRENMVKLAAKLDTFATNGEGWDTNQWLLGVQNGVVELRTGKLRDGRPDDLITKVSPVTFDPCATCPRWLQFLRDIFRDDDSLVQYIKRVLGYALTGDTGEQVFWILWGGGSNGKSTLIEVFMHHVLGDEYTWTMPFPSDKWSDALSEYHKATLVGRRFVAANEVRRRGSLNEELIKGLTGGDTVNARHPYGRPFRFVPVAKFFIRVNDKPEILDQSHGMWRRVKLIPFEQQFAIDRTFPNKLAAEAPGILAWAVEGCLEWQQCGLAHPAVVEAATDEYRAESDPLVQFLKDRCVEAPNASVGAMDLFREYENWCQAQDVPALDRMSQRALGTRMRQRFGVKEGRTVMYLGCGLLAGDL